MTRTPHVRLATAWRASFVALAALISATAAVMAFAREEAASEAAPTASAPSADVTAEGTHAEAKAADTPAIGYNGDVRPILANHCFKCHGPDEQTREAGLRLDVREAATAEADSGETAIVAGKPDESELIARIFSTDADVQMPPASANKPLTDEQRATLRAWIAAGAAYEPHWAFVPPRQAPLPPVADRQWPRNEIDHFVLARLEAAGLTPAPEADKYTLARRLYLDLIGLPPTPAEVDEFVNDESPAAYEALVDRLLASPHYGERWARRWLDLARYADTNGYEKDRVRTMWPYRDWVINALNADMPFDQFTLEQIAGDMLPGATEAQRIATGFHRNTMLNEEGGIDPQEFRFYATVDRVNTTGTVWLGLTVGCAQCHTHKYDPLPHHDYYRLMAFLNNADEPKLDVPQPKLAAERARIEKEIAAAEASLAERFPPEGEFRWQQPAVLNVASAAGAEIEAQSDGVVTVKGENPERDVYTIVLESDAKTVSSLRLEALPEAKGKRGPGRTPHGNFVLTEISITPTPADGPEGAGEPIALGTATSDFSQQHFSVDQSFDGNDNTGWAVDGPAQHVERTAIFRFAQPYSPSGGRTRFTVRMAQNYGGQHTLAKFRLTLGEPTNDARPVEVQRRDHLQRKFDEWLARETARAVRWVPLRPLSAVSDLPTLTVLDDDSVLVSGDITKTESYRLQLPNPLGKLTALRLELMPDDSLPARGPGRVVYEGAPGDCFLGEFRVTGADDKALKFAGVTDSYHSHRTSAEKTTDGEMTTGWSIDGGQGRAHTAVYPLAEPYDGPDLKLEMVCERYYASGLGRFRLWGTDATEQVATHGLPTEIEALLLVPAEERTGEDRALLLKHFLSIAPELEGERQAIAQLRNSLPEYPTALVFSERPAVHPRKTSLHKRGEFLQPVEEVHAELPTLFAPLGAHEQHDRLALARWLASDRNPLVGRVTVNRQWAALFGRGLVRTTEDFGYQGDPPTHPELLDWLSVEFMRQGWSLKKLHRMIVTSATYRQSAAATAEKIEKDPQNKLLSHAPRVRLDAELVRDAALRACGLLSEKIGGPSVFPPQPPGVSTETAYGQLEWKVSEGEDRYRRGMYTFAKRTAPYAMFNAFDAPSGEACLARRDVSNTPLQSLAMLNDTVFVEAAQRLGREMASGTGTVAERVEQLFRRCLSRPPSDDERSLLVAFYDAQFKRVAAGELDAEAINGTAKKKKKEDKPAAPEETVEQETAEQGSSQQPRAAAADDSVAARAAWTLTARAVLNLDEMITKE